MYVLDVCSGTGSVSRVLREMYPDAVVFSFDIDPKSAFQMDDKHVHVTCDVRELDVRGILEQHGVGNAERPEFVWCSPPCIQYSKARTYAKTPRDLDTADAIVAACMQIVDDLNPVKWVLENPATGLLPKRAVIERWARHLQLTTYCKWGFEYRKATAIWTNAIIDLPYCCRGDRCSAFLHTGPGKGYHACVAQRGRRVYSNGAVAVGGRTLCRLHRVPEGLVRALIGAEVFFGEVPGAVEA